MGDFQRLGATTAAIFRVASKRWLSSTGTHKTQKPIKMHTLLSCRTADGASHYSPPGNRSPLTEAVSSRILNYAVLSLSLALSLTHAHAL